MSVTAFLGVPGSGKSLHVMEELYWYGKRKDALIITNFELSKPRGWKAEHAVIPSGELSVNDLMEPFVDWLDRGNVVKRENQVLVVIDEAQIPFSNRDWQKSGRNDWVKLFIQHRKLGMRIILVVQDIGMIDKQIRACVETCGHHMRVNSYGWLGALVTVLLLGRPLCMCIYRLPFYGSTKAGIVGRQAVIGRKRYYRMYDTHAMFSKDLIDFDVWGESVPEITKGERLLMEGS